jgi:hypothetical protein
MNRVKTAQTPIVWLVLIAFLANTLFSQPVKADVSFLPTPGQMVPFSSSFVSPMILGLKVFKNNPFQFDFIMSEGKGNIGSGAERKIFLKKEADRLVRYFLASLTIPEKDMWVNLSPYDSNRIVAQEFGVTEMGKDMLAQDYLLKQVASTALYPEGKEGKEFWSKIYQEAYKSFGTTEIQVETFNKIWIVPDKATVYENAIDNTAVIVESKLKVMLEEDYLALTKHLPIEHTDKALAEKRKISNDLIRQIILPLIEKEVNTGKNFAVLRQVYNSLILAFWYKNKIKESLLSKGYVDRKKTHGIDVEDKDMAQEIFQLYVKAYKKGVFNYVKEDVGPDNQMIPRKYFSGGVSLFDLGGSRRRC